MTKNMQHRRSAYGRDQNRKKVMKISGAVLLSLLVITILGTAAATAGRKEPKIIIQTESAAVLQGEPLPKLKARVSLAGDKDVLLDKESSYSVGQLLESLKQGKGYSLSCSSDLNTEGTSPIQAELSSEIVKSLEGKWQGKIAIQIKEGKLTVKNKVGNWEKEKFKKYDGTYVENDFVNSKGKLYYFGADGKKATDWQKIGYHKYYFDKSGVMQTGWQEQDDGTYYLNTDGTMAAGWLNLEADTYFFTSEGKMVTGEKQVGIQKCLFQEDGTLISKEIKIDPEKPMMALTFDDGPGERTGELLDLLESYGAHATFFMLGVNVPKYPEAVAKMVQIGCELGNHSYDHEDLSKKDEAGIRQEVGDTNGLIQQAAGQPAALFRPPYGAIGDVLRSKAGMPLALWNVDTLDWKTKDARSTIDNVLNMADDGDIVLMHDIHSASIDAAMELIPKLIDQGYQLVTVSEMAKARGAVLENGKAFTDFNK